MAASSSSSSSTASSSSSTTKPTPVLMKTDLVLSSGRGLKELAKARLLECVRSVEPATGAKSFKVMVIDKHSLAVINSVCTMYDIMQENVSLVENLHKRREVLSRMEALYLLAPVEESVRLVIDDFRTDMVETQRRNQKVYRAAHLVFLSELPEHLLQMIGQSVLAEHVKTLKELNLHFIVAESQVFHTNMPASIPTLFGTGLADRQLSMQRRAEMHVMLATLCVTLGERPYVRAASGSDLAQDFAEGLEERLTAMQRSLPGYPPSRSSDSRATLLVVDRSVDPLAPLLHEFTYGAMAYDLLGIDPLANTYERSFVDSSDQQHTETTTIDERDPLWVQLRHGHIGKVGTVLSRQFQDFLAANKSAIELTRAGGVSVASYAKGSHGLRELRDAFNAVPQYRDMRSKYSLHMNIAGSCMDQMDARQLIKLATLQQKCVMGDKLKNPLDELHAVLSLPGLRRDDVARTVAVFCVAQPGISQDVRNALYARYELTAEQRAAIENLSRIGVVWDRPLVQTGVDASPAAKSKKKKGGKKDKDAPPTVSRYQPALKAIIENALADSLSTADFRYVGDSPPPSSGSAATRRSAWVANKLARQQAQEKKAARGTDGISPFVGARLIVFVLGGVTMSEMRAVYETTAETYQEVFLGSTHIITPQSFINEMAALR